MRPRSRRPVRQQIPTASRSSSHLASLSIGWLLALWPGRLPAGPLEASPLREPQVIELAKRADLDALEASAAVALAESRRTQARLHPNPSLGYAREHFPGDGVSGESEDTLTLSLPLDLSSRRSTQDELARAGVAHSRALAARTRSAGVLRALELFHELAAEKRRAVVGKAALARLERAAHVTTRRLREGTVSGYALTRIEIETELAASSLREIAARVQRLRAALSLRLGIDGDPAHFEGSLEPDVTLIDPETRAPVTPPSSIASLQEAEARSSEARRRSQHAWIPGVSVSAGALMGRGATTRYGYVAGLSLELPVFSRGQGLEDLAHASERLARERAGAAERRARISTVTAELALRDALDESRRFERALPERIQRLERAATAAYREGERSLESLLEASRLRTTVELRGLELARALKRAEVNLRAARGEFE